MVSSLSTNRESLHVMVLTYEFTFSPFSGNGILARSIVKALLGCNCRVTVWCCRPHSNHASTNDNHLTPPEISKEQANRLDVHFVTLSSEIGWRRLDDESGWNEFNWSSLTETSASQLTAALKVANVVCVIDWTGGCAWQSMPVCVWKKRASRRPPPMVYLNFRVYSSGIVDKQKHEWYDDMECRFLKNAKTIITLSEKDKKSLVNLMDNHSTSEETLFVARQSIHILYPPLRGDIESLTKHPMQHVCCDHLPSQVEEAILSQSQQCNRCFVTCVVRLSPEKDTMRFVKFVEATSHLLAKCGFTPLLAGAAADANYALHVKRQLKRVAPHAVIVESFLSPAALATVFSRAALNFHPCAYDAYGMTIVEAAVFGVPSVVAKGNVIGATATVNGNGVFEVHMPPCSHDTNKGTKHDCELSENSIKELQAVLQDRKRMEATGAIAKKQALAWDETAYGSALMAHLRSTMNETCN